MPTLAERRGSSLRARRNQLKVDTALIKKEEFNFKRVKKLPAGVKIFDLYTWDEVIQEEGDGGKVVVCRPKESDDPSQDYVMKIRSKKSLHKNHMAATFVRVQEQLLNLSKHSGVIAPIEVLEDAHFYYMLMEKAEGGSFLEGLVKEFGSGPIPASEVKRLIAEILDAVGHVHSQGMLHRDIKPDNFVMQFKVEPSSPSGRIMSPKLVDFDHAEPDWTPNSPTLRKEWCGTMFFNAPETFHGIFSEQSDLYSIGTCLYLLMAGKFPYSEHLYSDNFDEIFDNLQGAEVDWTCDPWPDQTECRDFCQNLIAFSPKYRVHTVAEARANAWLPPSS